MEHISNHLQKWEHPKQELTGPRVGEFSNAFVEAVNFPSITHRPIEDLKECLRWIMVKIGLRFNNWPAEEEKDLLLKHILSHYGNHSIPEIKLAFNMAMMGKLDVEVNCYENFSCLYFSTIMNAYRQWAKDQYKEIKPIMIENKEKLSDTTMQEWLEDVREGVKSGRLTVDLLPMMIYDHLVSEGKIKDKVPERYLQQAVEFRQAFLYKAAESMDKTDNKIFGDFMRMKEAGCFEGEEVNRLKNLSKKMILWDYLKQ